MTTEPRTPEASPQRSPVSAGHGFLRVRQPQSACTFCKTRKIKCDGLGPACTPCVKSGRASSCSIRTERRGYEKDYVTYLEKRIQRLHVALNSSQRSSRDTSAVDAQVEGLATPQNQNSHQDNSGPTQHASRNLQLPPEQPSRPARNHGTTGHMASTIDLLISEIGALPIIASSYNLSSAEGPSLSAIVLAAAGCKDMVEMGANAKADLGAIRACLLTSLPNRGTSHKLIEHYLSTVYSRMPFFSVQGLWDQFQFAYSAVDSLRSSNDVNWDTHPPAKSGVDNLFSSATTHGMAPTINHGSAFFTVLIVLAISTSSLSRSADSIVSSNAKELFKLALQFTEYAVFPNTIMGLQAILFLVQYATLNPSHLSAWYLIGFGMRICVDLGLHQDPPPHYHEIPASMLETRRQLFWSMYSYDRSMSLSLSQPCEISNDVIKVAFPTFRVDSSVSEDEILYYLQRYRIIQLQSFIFDRLYTPVEPLNAELAPEVVDELMLRIDTWTERNPQSSSTHQRLLMESERLQTLILLHRPCWRMRERSANDLLKLWDACLRFVRIYRNFVEDNKIFYISVASEKIFTTGLALFYVYWQVHRSDRTPEKLEVAAAVKAVDLWNGIRDSTYALQVLSERWADGKILTRRFEAIAETGVAILSAEGNLNSTVSDGEPLGLPNEIVEFWKYRSVPSKGPLVSKHYGNDNLSGSPDPGEPVVDMHDLVLEIVRGRTLMGDRGGASR